MSESIFYNHGPYVIIRREGVGVKLFAGHRDDGELSWGTCIHMAIAYDHLSQAKMAALETGGWATPLELAYVLVTPP